ncbi:hypothetical protein D3C72_1983880 [compost metagenome]
MRVLRSALTSPFTVAWTRLPPSPVKCTTFWAVTREKLAPTRSRSLPISCFRGLRYEIEKGTSGRST